ncbi:MAG: DNA repair protein RadA, partial [Mogibacterium diversum]|nr:DNA repair protein RadA [Mogibacterium diversum]
KPDGPGADLAVALAIYSSFRERTSPRRVVALGEVGLTGNLRAVRSADRIVGEAARLGYEAVILPRGNVKASNPNADIEVVGAESLASAIKAFIGKN